MSTRPLAVGDIVTWKSDTDFGWGSAVWEVTDLHHVGTPHATADLAHLRRNRLHNRYSVDLLRRLTAAERKAAGIGQGRSSSSPGRTYLIGLPVTITVHDDGTVTASVHTEDIVEDIADVDDTTYDETTIHADSVTAGRAMSMTTYTVEID